VSLRRDQIFGRSAAHCFIPAAGPASTAGPAALRRAERSEDRGRFRQRVLRRFARLGAEGDEGGAPAGIEGATARLRRFHLSVVGSEGLRGVAIEPRAAGAARDDRGSGRERQRSDGGSSSVGGPDKGRTEARTEARNGDRWGDGIRGGLATEQREHPPGARALRSGGVRSFERRGGARATVGRSAGP